MDASVIKRISDLVDSSGRSRADLSVSIGRDKSYLSTLLGKENPPDPGATTMRNLAAELCVSMDVLMCVDDQISIAVGEHASDFQKLSAKLASEIATSAQRILAARGQRPKIEDMLQWHKETGGVLTGTSRFEDYVDLIEVPEGDANIVHPFRVGPQSLAAETLQKNDPNLLYKVVEDMPVEQRRKIVESYQAAFTRRGSHPIDDLTVTVPYLSKPGGFDVNYFSVRLPVKVPVHGPSKPPKDFIMSFCSPTTVA
ncbi:MAG: hypothetical protein AAFQ38_14985 [Pseudomonadota bacterium]